MMKKKMDSSLIGLGVMIIAWLIGALISLGVTLGIIYAAAMIIKSVFGL